MPGISAMTTTAGPEPATCTILVTSPSLISRRAKSSRGSSLLRLRFVICLAGFQRLTRECHGGCESEDQSTHVAHRLRRKIKITITTRSLRRSYACAVSSSDGLIDLSHLEAQLRIHSAAAQTRTVSAGTFCRS